jgi:hypothetical protein
MFGCCAIVSQDEVELFWTPYPGATEYQVVRDGILTVGSVTSPSINDSSLVAGTTYSYTVRANTGAGFGADSLPVSIVTPDASSTDTLCEGNTGHIHEFNYANNAAKRWRIAPAIPFTYINLEVSVGSIAYHPRRRLTFGLLRLI